jgi:hypothetical protein
MGRAGADHRKIPAGLWPTLKQTWVIDVRLRCPPPEDEVPGRAVAYAAG